MWKPRVLHSRFAAGLGGSSARFAGEILARRAPAPDSGLYPEAWLVFREEEEREAAQAAGEVRLTQITLRLALQLSEYFTAPVREERTVMELTSLRQTLRTCLTALETRDRETCREVRTLMALSREERGEEPSASTAVRERSGSGRPCGSGSRSALPGWSGWSAGRRRGRSFPVPRPSSGPEGRGRSRGESRAGRSGRSPLRERRRRPPPRPSCGGGPRPTPRGP